MQVSGHKGGWDRLVASLTANPVDPVLVEQALKDGAPVDRVTEDGETPVHMDGCTEWRNRNSQTTQGLH